MNRFRIGASLGLLTLLGYFYFPGHTFLASDSQIYVPILERLQNPTLFEKDMMATRPLAYSLYDPVALVLTSYTSLSLQWALQLEQLLFRGVAVAAIFLIARSIGLPPVAAWFVAAVLSLGEPAGAGLAESEPIPRAFALACILLGTALALRGRPGWAGVLGALALLYHPTTAIWFWIAAAFPVWRRTVSPVILAPLLPAIGLLAIMAHSNPGAVETPALFHRLDATEEALQRAITGYLFVSEFSAKTFLELVAQCAVMALGLWKLREQIRGVAWDLLAALGMVGALSLPVSYVVLELAHFPQFQPTRALVLLTLVSALVATACSLFAASQGRWIQSAAWLAIPLLESTEPKLISWFATPFQIVAAIALLAAMVLGQMLAKRSGGITLALAGALPIFLIPLLGLADPPRTFETPELDQVAQWARQQTPEDTVFLFPDAGHSLEPGVFRARSLRAHYVDWKSRGHANYFPSFEWEWTRRWNDTHTGHWMVTKEDFPALREFHVDYLVVSAEHPILGTDPMFRNSRFIVYRVL